MKLYAIFTAVVYTIGWLFCVLCGANQITLWPPLVTTAAVFLQLFLLKKFSRQNYYQDVFLLGYAVLIGFFMELIFINAGFLTYATENVLYGGFPPGWIWSLYFFFALTLNHSLSFLKLSPLLPFLFGLFGGAFSYWVGEKMGAVTLSSWEAVALIGLLWGSYLTLIFSISNRLAPLVSQVADEKLINRPFTIFYDSICPICSREIAHLKKRNSAGLVKFYDLVDEERFEKEYPEIDYLSAMKEIHAIGADGKILKGINAFTPLYARTGFPVLAILLQAPGLQNSFKFCYGIWAKYRFKNRCKIKSLDT